MAVAPHQIHQCCQISSLIRWVNEELIDTLLMEPFFVAEALYPVLIRLVNEELIATLLMEPFLAAEAGSCQQNNELYSICLHKHTVHFNR